MLSLGNFWVNACSPCKLANGRLLRSPINLLLVRHRKIWAVWR